MMKISICQIIICFTFCIGVSNKANAQFTYANNEATTNNQIVAPVLRISNELRVANTFIPTDPSIGTLDNTGYGINIHKTSGIGFAFNGVHQMVFKPNGNTGIGTEAPQGKLHVSTGTFGDAIVRLEADTDNNNESDNPLIQLRQDGGQVGINIGFSEENFGGNIFGIGTRYTNQESWHTFTINTSNGNVGIGTKNAGTWKLAVKGKIRAEEIKVETGWADYVFKDDYDLPTLEEVEKYINEKGHLINIPSAEEVEANGIELGEMNKLLLEKIEELVLYTLEQEKNLIELKAINKKQEERLNNIEALLKQK
ncbi:hypothetical protein HZY62_13470 [Maribacter polysiphoniae]|uniref:Endosialidase-like protein n=1 Tax=Maribacter polysiphoniae TaxID=429344 RepID=A0A316DXG5_9FLAO|nr:hypothetical protein [Maribacter polysiphoniae]MBD1261608.1 hypothetical protein [Maribacter polysiphoniae]PWK22595.1 hypothetical protein LX92_03070 [Maribacter polysiphoniae]